MKTDAELHISHYSLNSIFGLFAHGAVLHLILKPLDLYGGMMNVVFTRNERLRLSQDALCLPRIVHR